MNNNELVFLPAASLASEIRNKQISPVEAVEAYLQQINRVDPKLNAYITVLADQALDAARESESDITSGINRGPLHGVPIAVKDQIYTKGIRTSSASKIRSDFVPDFDASVVTGLKSSGAIILGKLNMTELFDWYQKGLLKPLIEESYPLSQAASVLEKILARGAKGKIILTP